MADTPSSTPQAPPPDDLLDLTDLVAHRPVLTSAGQLAMRQASALGPLDRVEVQQAWARMAQAEDAMAQLPLGADAKARRQAARAYTAAEDSLLRLVLVDVTPEQLAVLPQHERTALGVAFYGATAETIRRAVAVGAMAGAAAPIGERPSPDSNGSTAATPTAG